MNRKQNLDSSSDEQGQTKSLILCPFCGETDFDLIGLKKHLLAGWCEVFNATEDL